MSDEVKVLVLENCLIKQNHFDINQKLFLDFETASKLQKMNRVKILDVDVVDEKDAEVEKEEVVITTKKPRKQRTTKVDKEE